MTVPYSYQLEDVRKIHKLGGRILLAWEQGLGKSFGTLLYMHRHPEVLPTVVVCPASIKWQWASEASRHFGMRSEVLEGTKPDERIGAIVPPLTIINYDILHAWMDYLKTLNPQMVVLDEVQYITTRTTRRSKQCRLLCKGVPKILELSGTPLLNRPAELWHPLNLLRPDLFTTFYPFAMKYCNPKKTPWGWDFRGASNLTHLHNTLCNGDGVMIRRRKEDVLKQLPSKIRSVIPIPIENRKEYDAAVKDFLGWLAKKSINKALRAAKSQSLVKLGYLKRMAGKLKLPLAMQWVDDFLANGDQKIVLFAVHKDIISTLQKRYKPICVAVDGSTANKNRQHAVRQFQGKDSCRVFIGNIKAAGVGLTLTAASTVAFLELDWVPGVHAQAEDRIHRIGQKETAQCVYLVAHDTIESKLCEVLQTKQKTLSAVLDGGKGDNLNVFDQLINKLEEQS